MHQRRIPTWLYVVVVTLATSTHAWAGPIVFFSTDDLGGGVFQYDLTVKNMPRQQKSWVSIGSGKFPS